MTHTQLIERAERWLRNSLNCRVVLTELVAYTQSGETPDAIGFRCNETILIEAKTSKSDFYRDRTKPSRNWKRSYVVNGETKHVNLRPALGDWRFYLTPPGLLDGCKLPEGWGWYEVHGRSVRHAGGPKYRNMTRERPCKSHWHSERAMLISALARVNANVASWG